MAFNTILIMTRIGVYRNIKSTSRQFVVKPHIIVFESCLGNYNAMYIYAWFDNRGYISGVFWYTSVSHFSRNSEAYKN